MKFWVLKPTISLISALGRSQSGHFAQVLWRNRLEENSKKDRIRQLREPIHGKKLQFSRIMRQGRSVGVEFQTTLFRCTISFIFLYRSSISQFQGPPFRRICLVRDIHNKPHCGQSLCCYLQSIPSRNSIFAIQFHTSISSKKYNRFLSSTCEH